jgi:signal transduction histidine kinase
MLNVDLWLRFITMLNVIIGLFLVALVFWQNILKKSHSKSYTAFLFILLLLLVLQSMEYFVYPQVLVLLLLILAFYQQIIQQSKKKHKQTPSNSLSSVLIEQAKQQERSRIYANLHDDVGAKLLELIYSAKDERTKALAKEVLGNMRQAVASTVNIQCTVQQLMDEIIAESTLRLQVADIQFSKKINLHDEKQKLPATVPSVFSRIIREVMSNIIKHSQAKTVQLIVLSTKASLNISIIDDGIGYKTNSNQGKGFKTIQKRAKSILAEVKWESENQQGTQFKLHYPYVNQ